MAMCVCVCAHAHVHICTHSRIKYITWKIQSSISQQPRKGGSHDLLKNSLYL